jgi:hypothetical protein
VDDLEKLEELQLDTFEVGKDKLRIVTIMPLDERKQFDIGLPTLTPTLVRKKSLAEEIASLDVMAFQTMLLPLGAYTATCTVTSIVGLSASASTVLQVSNAALTNSISPTSGISGVTQFAVSGSGATPNQGVTATITMPNATTTTSHATANNSGQYAFGPFHRKRDRHLLRS